MPLNRHPKRGNPLPGRRVYHVRSRAALPFTLDSAVAYVAPFLSPGCAWREGKEEEGGRGVGSAHSFLFLASREFAFAVAFRRSLVAATTVFRFTDASTSVIMALLALVCPCRRTCVTLALDMYPHRRKLRHCLPDDSSAQLCLVLGRGRHVSLTQ